MSNQEIWITLRIKSELPVERNALTFAECFANELWWNNLNNEGQKLFLSDAHAVDVMEVKEERHIYGTAEDKPYTLEE